jgi:hypothetical protein
MHEVGRCRLSESCSSGDAAFVRTEALRSRSSSSEGQRKAELRERAEEILPTGARGHVLGYGDCVELAPSPLCDSRVRDARA